MFSNLWENVNYTAPLPSYTGFITEYDLSKANISALFSRGVITKDLYDDLYGADKHYREVMIGIMIKRDRGIYEEIAAGIKDAKRMLFEANNIQDSEILSINNDAVFFAGSFLSFVGLLLFPEKSLFCPKSPNCA